MPLDPSFVGRSWPPTAPYLVGREKIREFATAIGATDAEYHDPEAARALGYPDVVAPPTFPTVVTMAASRQIVDDPGAGHGLHPGGARRPEVRVHPAGRRR